jgi:hypothetical protein
MEARKNLLVFTILLFLVLFITYGKMLLLPYAVLFISAEVDNKLFAEKRMKSIKTDRHPHI